MVFPIAAAIAMAWLTVAAAQTDCTVTLESREYNVSRMLRPGSLPYNVTGKSSSYKFNVCLNKVVCGAGSAMSPAACEVDFITEMDYGYGDSTRMSITTLASADIEFINTDYKLSTPEFPPGDYGVTIRFVPLSSSSETSVVVLVPCDPSATDTPLISDDGSYWSRDLATGGSSLVFVVPSVGGCPVGEDFGSGSDGGAGMSAGWIFVIVFICGTVVYCIGGIVFKHQKYGYSGLESIPHVEFWREVPSLIKDGMHFTHTTFSGVFYPDSVQEYAGTGVSSESSSSYTESKYPVPLPVSKADYSQVKTDPNNAFAVDSYNDL